jgi:hypothetical protein
MPRRSGNVRTVPRVARRVRSSVEPPPAAELLGAVVGSPWTAPSAWLDEALVVRLEPDAVRFAWRVSGQRRVAIAAEFVSCGAQPCAVCDGDCYTHGPYFWEYRHNRGGGVDRFPLERLARRSPPPTLADVAAALNEWRASHEAMRAEQRWRAEMPPADVRNGPRPDFRTGPTYDFRSTHAYGGVPPPHHDWPHACETGFPRETADEPPGRRSRPPFEPPDESARREQLEQLVADMKLLGLERGFTKDDLKKAHRKCAVELHPDRGGDPEKAKQVNAAYQRLVVLSEKAS